MKNHISLKTLYQQQVGKNVQTATKNYVNYKAQQKVRKLQNMFPPQYQNTKK